MVERTAFAVFCLVIGFGLGRLRLHGIVAAVRKSRKPKGGRAHTVLLSQERAIEIWTQVFSESSQMARDFFKWLIGTGAVCLTVTAALWTVKGSFSSFKYPAMAFTLALLITALPTARMTNRLNNEAQRLGARIARTSKGRPIPVTLPYIWTPGKLMWVENFAMIVLGLSMFVLLYALSEM
ncbi:hypothetical protein ACOTD7_19265 [Achromobacter xylosoxidans]